MSNKKILVVAALVFSVLNMSHVGSFIDGNCFNFLLLFSAAGCTFEEDSDPNLCDFTQGEEDDFDWLLFRTYSSPYASSDLLRGECPCFFRLRPFCVVRCL